jgi:hypothetical protein
MKTTARFNVVRKRPLGRLFSAENLSTIWRSVVRAQMRSTDILDIHDYYDFNLVIEQRAKEIRSLILRGQYKASSPLIYGLEKRYGVCRHLMIPSPSDALVFQTITEHLAGPLKHAQPTDKAYYSRDKHVLQLPHQFEEVRGYPWGILWPKFQKDIWKFTEECPYLVVTDVTDFFDNIGLRELRHIVSARIKVDEVVLDLLFNIIEQLSWVPDYLPASLKGLPTINLEAFRLLAHVMLFEIDEVLDKNANGNFVRWMDDINIGVSSKDQAFAILRDTNDVLKSRGLALNLSKTSIYTAAEAKKHFMVDENMYLDDVQKADPTASDFGETRKEFLRRFRLHLKNSNLRIWDKVTKRYFTVAKRLGITKLRDYSYQLFVDFPSIRGHILGYLGSLPLSKPTRQVILDLLRDVHRYDDVTLFNFCKLVTTMEIPRSESGKEFVKAVQDVLLPAKSGFDLYCRIWFSAKYCRPHQLMTLIESTRKQWSNDPFLARQVMAVVPRLLQFNKEAAMRLLNEEMRSGPRDAASVAANIHSLLMTEIVADRLYAYLFPPKPQKPYPLPKYLILTTVLSSQYLRPVPRQKLNIKVRQYINDQWYLHWLETSGLIA